jgi:ABC-type glycerol-3-phosphate transport system substrate-binding protein
MTTSRSVHIFRYLIGSILLIPALLLLAFGPRADESLPHGRVIVDYWEKWTGEEGAQLKQIVDWFNETVGKEKNIYVRLLSTSSINQKTLVSTAAGVPPDIAGLWEPNVPQFAALNALEPLDDLAREYGITRETYKDVFWQSCSYDGKLYALVSTPYDVALHYNKTIFQQKAEQLRAAGLDPNRAPRTIDELDAYAKAIDDIGPNGQIRMTGYLPLEPGWFLNYNCLWFGGHWWDDVNKKFTFTRPEVIQTYQWVQSYSKRLGKSAVADFRSGFGNFDSPQNAFIAGTVAMVQQGTYMANFIHNIRPQLDGQWAAAPFPSVRADQPPVTYCTADVFVIPKGARHKREAFEFIAFVNRQDVMEKLCSMHCKISPLRKVSESYLANHGNPYIRLFEDMANSPNAYTTPRVPILPEVGEELSNMVQRLALMETTPEEALRDIEPRLQKKYDEFMDRQNRRKANANQPTLHE